MRTIDADAFKKYIDTQEGRPFIGCTVGEAMKILIDEQPTIQPEKAQLSKEGTTKDAISRQEAIDLFPSDVLEWDTLNGYIAPHVARRLIEQLPTIQPEPHEGHWIEGGIYRDVIECNCSECGQLMTTAATVRMNFCPNCGAKMKGVTK